LIDAGYPYDNVQNMPLDEFYIHLEGAKRYLGHRRKQEFLDLSAAISGSFSKNGIQKYLNNLDDQVE